MSFGLWALWEIWLWNARNTFANFLLTCFIDCLSSEHLRKDRKYGQSVEPRSGLKIHPMRISCLLGMFTLAMVVGVEQYHILKIPEYFSLFKSVLKQLCKKKKKKKSCVSLWAAITTEFSSLHGFIAIIYKFRYQ